MPINANTKYWASLRPDTEGNFFLQCLETFEVLGKELFGMKNSDILNLLVCNYNLSEVCR